MMHFMMMSQIVTLLTHFFEFYIQFYIIYIFSGFRKLPRHILYGFLSKSLMCKKVTPFQLLIIVMSLLLVTILLLVITLLLVTTLILATTSIMTITSAISTSSK